MTKSKLLWVAPVLAMLCLGCANKDVDAPVEAPEIDNRFSLQHVWSTSTGGVDGFFSQMHPTISGNAVYIASRDGDVSALSLDAGKKLWTTDLGDEEENDTKRSARLSGGVSAYGGKVAVGSENGYIYLLNAADGKLLWKDYLGCEIVSAPAFSESTGKIFVLDSIGRVHAYEVLNGQKLWTSGDSNNSLHLRSQSEPLAVGDDYVIIGAAHGQVYIISQQNGMILDQITVTENYGTNDLARIADVAATPLLLDGKMFTTAYNGGFVSYDFDAKSIVNRLPYHSSKALGFDDSHFVITEDHGQIYCINRYDNTELWVNAKLRNRNVTAPVVYGNYVVVGDFEGYLYFINLQSGVIESMFDLEDAAIMTAPQVINGNLLVYYANGDLEMVRYDPTGAAASKALYAQNELAAGKGRVKVSEFNLNNISFGLTAEQLQERRRQAVNIVNQIEARQRAAEAQLAEYNRRKAEYERQKAEYERQRRAYEEQKRQELSGFGIMPGVKSEDDEVVAPQETPESASPEVEENANEKSSSFGI